jgi:hypothetical protein
MQTPILPANCSIAEALLLLQYSIEAFTPLHALAHPLFRPGRFVLRERMRSRSLNLMIATERCQR